MGQLPDCIHHNTFLYRAGHAENDVQQMIHTGTPLHADPEASPSTLTKDVCGLARKLFHADAFTFSLLNCQRVVKVIDPAKKKVTSFDFVFRVAEGMEDPRSLRNILISGDGNLSLSHRFKVAETASHIRQPCSHVEIEKIVKGTQGERDAFARGTGSRN